MSFEEKPLGESENEFVDVSSPVELDPESQLEEIRVAAEAISTEAFAGLDSLKDAIEKVPALLSKVTGFITNKFNRENVAKSIYKPHVIGSLSRSANYLTYSKMRVYKSVGQKCTTAHLVSVLDQALASTISVFLKVELPHAESVIAKFAADPMEMKSVRYQDIISKTLDGNYKASVKSLADCFDGKDTSSEEEFGKLYERNADFEFAIKELSRINEEVYKMNMDDVLRLTDRLNGSFHIIVSAIDNREPGYDISPNAIKTLADACYQIAALLEFYSVYLFKLRECTVAVKDTVDALKGI